MAETNNPIRVSQKALQEAANELSAELDYKTNPTPYLEHLAVPDKVTKSDKDLQMAAYELNRELALEREAKEQSAVAAAYSLDPEPYLAHLSAPHISPVEDENVAFPASYAAFVRLYIEWMEMSEDEQIKFVEKNVKIAGKMHKKVTKSGEGIPFFEPGHEMYGEDFVGYRDEAWATQAEHFSDVDAFALYLEKNLMRYGKFPMSGDILRRAAQNMLETMRRQQIKHSKVLSYDSPCQDDDGDDIEIQIPDHSEALENIVTYQDFVSYIRSLLKNNVRVKVFDLLLDGYKQTEIAEMITVIDRNGEEKTISPVAVSKHVQKIRNLIDSVT